ncbi:PIN domain-containing protein [Pyrococcus kukulkanii]|uniref:type II toxin-antitoxin system VapC family toxin n=1 Tax=Pyrococcus kukulkanii TaxID=1609559 RepID=UPI003566AA81
MVKRPKYVDVNVFIYWLTSHPEFGKKAKMWIKRMERGGEYITSSLTLYEVLEKTLTPLLEIQNLRIEPLLKQDFVNALSIAKKYKLDLEDSLHLSVAIRTGCESIVSNDKDFDKTELKRIF